MLFDKEILWKLWRILGEKLSKEKREKNCEKERTYTKENSPKGKQKVKKKKKWNELKLFNEPFPFIHIFLLFLLSILQICVFYEFSGSFFLRFFLIFVFALCMYTFRFPLFDFFYVRMCVCVWKCNIFF